MVYPHQNNTDELLKLTDISLSYGQFMALKNINLALNRSEVHGIVGEHGAGKSSLGMIISGMLKPQSGLITFDGKDYRLLALNTAIKFGIEMVHQHQISLNTCFSVAENFSFANVPINKFLWKNKKRLVGTAQSFLSQYRVDINPSIPIKNLSSSAQIFVDILKHIYPQPRLLVLDEALEKLASEDFNKIVSILMKLKHEGTSILLITHRIDDIYALADRVSVIKNGEILFTDKVENIDKINLIKMAYTQISTEENIENLNKEFYQLLKYNEAILRNLPVNLIITDNENQIKLVNEYCKLYFQLEKISYLGVPLSQLVSSNNEEVLNLLKSPCSSGEEKTFYQVPILFNGIHTISNMKVFPIYDGTFLIGTIIIIEDMTEYEQLQNQVMLSEKLASVGLLAAGVAHEINNPLEIVYNSLTFLKYHIHGDTLREAIVDIQGEMSSISNIVSNLHSFSDDKQLSNEVCSINDLIRNMLHLIQYSARHKEIRIHFEPYKEDISITANKNEMKQVILNLFKNSFEAMPSGGEIFIKTSGMTEHGSNMVQITFQDTGPGICDKNPGNIFLPFYSTKHGSENNLGLGLSVSYGIIQKYNGTIAVKNIESGCQFIITLPQLA
jgi:signal transduction histidine kinase/ABC-type molybdenum transport system ATPase subunit/photorepair protein PhrA